MCIVRGVARWRGSASVLSTDILFRVRLAVGPVGEEVRLRVTISAHFPVRASSGQIAESSASVLKSNRVPQFLQLEIRNLQNTPMSIRTTTTGQEMRKTIPKPNPNLNRVSMIWAATRSNMSKYGAIPTRKAAPLIKRKNLPTFCTVVSGFWFTSAICANPEYQLSASPSGFMEFTPPQDPQSPPDQRRSRSRHEHHRPMATMLREYADLATSRSE